VGGNYLIDALQFLVQTLFGLYIAVVMARFLLAQVRADFNNPLSQFVVKATQPLLRPMRRVIPPMGRVDSSSLVLMLLLQITELVIFYLLRGQLPAVPGLLLAGIGELVNLALNFYLVLLLVMVVSSWIGGGGYSPVLMLVDQLCAPLLRPLRKNIPPIGPLDVSVLVAFLLLQLAKILLVAPLMDAARSLM